MTTIERILDTASRLFYKQGYNCTGINQVIKEADVAKASLYQHFRSKDDLLIQYLNDTALEMSAALRKDIAKYTTPREKILSLFDFMIHHSEQTEFKGCNFLNIVSEIGPENTVVRNIIKNQKLQTRNLFREILIPIGKEDLADEIYLLYDAASITSKVHAEIWPIKTAKKIAEKLLA